VVVGGGGRRAAKCRREAPFEALAGRELRVALNNKGERLAEGRFRRETLLKFNTAETAA
jgi:hypothetical protein